MPSHVKNTEPCEFLPDFKVELNAGNVPHYFKGGYRRRAGSPDKQTHTQTHLQAKLLLKLTWGWSCSSKQRVCQI